jgi:hypothetical protein
VFVGKYDRCLNQLDHLEMIHDDLVLIVIDYAYAKDCVVRLDNLKKNNQLFIKEKNKGFIYPYKQKRKKKYSGGYLFPFQFCD